jgi:membrane glycosyltransferase
LIITLAISPMLALWTAPVTLSLLFAPMLSAAVAKRMKPGTRLARLLATPEDERIPDVVHAAAVASAKLAHIHPATFEDLVQSDDAAHVHAGLVDTHWALNDGAVHAPTAFVLARLEMAGRDAAQVLARFTREERMAVINRPDLLARLSRALRGTAAQV